MLSPFNCVFSCMCIGVVGIWTCNILCTHDHATHSSPLPLRAPLLLPLGVFNPLVQLVLVLLGETQNASARCGRRPPSTVLGFPWCGVP